MSHIKRKCLLIDVSPETIRRSSMNKTPMEKENPRNSLINDFKTQMCHQWILSLKFQRIEKMMLKKREKKCA